MRYFHYAAEVRRHFSLFAIFRTLVVRAKLQRTDPLHRGDGVPFYWQPVLDQDTALRGFEKGRFRDLGALLFNVEYRYPIWDFCDGVLFLDEGQVFHDYGDIELGRFQWSAGGEIRLFMSNQFYMRAVVATSDENVLFMMKLAQVF